MKQESCLFKVFKQTRYLDTTDVKTMCAVESKGFRKLSVL